MKFDWEDFMGGMFIATNQNLLKNLKNIYFLQEWWIKNLSRVENYNKMKFDYCLHIFLEEVFYENIMGG